MARRGNGEGTITRRKDGRWEARYYVPTVNGTKRKTLYGRTQAEVRVKLTKPYLTASTASCTTTRT
jgi:integrase